MKNQLATLLCRVLILLSVFGLLLSSTATAATNDTTSTDVDRKNAYNLKLGGAKLIKTTTPFKRVTIANAAIADVVVLSPSEIYVYGKALGFTSMMLWESGQTKTVLNVAVSLDITALKEQLYELYPDQQVEVYGSETGVVLSGTVSGPEIVEQVLRLTRTFLPRGAEGDSDTAASGRSGSGITNLLRVGNLQQVMLEVTFAEVSRNSGRDLQVGMGLDNLGSDLDHGFTTGAAGVGILGSLQDTGSLLLNMASNPANIFLEIDHFTAALQFLEEEGLARTLAEPRLVTLSGQEASFLAGGKYPVPTIGNDGEISVEFEDFGVGLSFTPVVMSDGKISLRVAPSVTNITGLSQTTAGPVPIMSTRELETSVQLHDGQTLALAGLLQDNMSDVVTKVPFLGDIPVLGALFRSTSYQMDKTDLLIAVTPHLVQPVAEGSISFPGEDMQLPNRYEFYLEGRLEGRRADDDESIIKRHNFSEMPSEAARVGGMEGDFGYQPVKAD
ncbi:MAG: type II and III secretion system protein family protein [Desulfobulbaceae bacterium]|jgi:pilus assembly protein CpaC|nr:type II and III secretion system protein family protein [Desulfobulbaceae bacterium]